MSAGLIALLTLSVIAGCSGNTFKMGACPRVVVMDQFDFDRFSGEWYVIQRFNPMATCTKFEIEKGSDGVFTVNETSRPLGLNFGSFHTEHLRSGRHRLRQVRRRLGMRPRAVRERAERRHPLQTALPGLGHHQEGEGHLEGNAHRHEPDGQC
ncbi:unnamed protein product [Larinioides sclopetarius]|uniref:Lipocalin/cytosolic fatty-acid binding domain-containing protein n=1 Tax=Larinioides sclopetarius TaxID=280406 RepID=A0AAV2BJI4_9ARAC